MVAYAKRRLLITLHHNTTDHLLTTYLQVKVLTMKHTGLVVIIIYTVVVTITTQYG